MSYAAIRQRLLGVAFVFGPLLLVASAVILVLDIDRNPGAMSWGSSTEGVVGFFGFILLVPVFLALADLLGTYRPRLAAVAAVTGLVGVAGGGVMNMVLRAEVPDLINAGASVTVLDQLYANVERGAVNLMPLLATGPLISVTAIVLGVGFLLARVHRRLGWLLIWGGVLLPLGQLFLVATDVMYTTALVIWAVAFVPLGIKLLRGEALESSS